MSGDEELFRSIGSCSSQEFCLEENLASSYNDWKGNRLVATCNQCVGWPSSYYASVNALLATPIKGGWWLFVLSLSPDSGNRPVYQWKYFED